MSITHYLITAILAFPASPVSIPVSVGNVRIGMEPLENPDHPEYVGSNYDAQRHEEHELRLTFPGSNYSLPNNYVVGDACALLEYHKGSFNGDTYNLFLEKYNREKKEHCAAVAKACTPLDLRKRILQELLEETETCRADLVRREGPGPQIEDLLRKISQL